MSFVSDWLFHGKDWLESLGYWTLPAYMVIYLVTTLMGLPAVFLFLAAGSIFGLIKGFIIVSLIDSLSTAAAYSLGRNIARPYIKEWILKRPQFAKLDRVVAKKGWKIVLLTRLSPIIPSGLLNYSFSLTRINFWQYLFVSWLGMLPIIGVYVYIGSVGINLAQGKSSPQQMALSIVGLFASLGALLYTTRLTQKILSRSSYSSQKLNGKK